MSSLYEKIGGDAAVNAAVDLFYKKVLSDNHVSSFFDSINMDDQSIKLKSFLTMAFGGPNHYSGKSLRAAHAPLVAKGLDESHFTAVAEHLQETLEELGVPSKLIQEVMTIAASTIDDVLNR